MKSKGFFGFVFIRTLHHITSRHKEKKNVSQHVLTNKHLINRFSLAFFSAVFFLCNRPGRKFFVNILGLFMVRKKLIFF